MAKKKDGLVRGDKLRNVIYYVYLHNQFSKDKIKVADLKKTVGYSTGGVYGAFESGYLEKKNDEIFLTPKGEIYVKDKILPQFSMYKSMSNVLIVLGGVFLLQWFEWAYLDFPLILPWHAAILIIGLGLFLRFFVLRLSFLIMRKTKKIEYP
jgi:hypothetical protein